MSNYMSYDRYNPQTKSDQNARTNIDQDLRNSRTTKYKERQLEVKQYLHDVITPHYPELFAKKFSTDNTTSYIDTVDLMDMLKDGEILCKLGSLIPEVPHNPTLKFKNSKMAFIQMENISFFLKLCEFINLQHDEIFQTVDLYERKDPYQVIVTLMSFSRLANEIDSTTFPNVIGPKVFKVKPQVPNKPYVLRR
ncbi:Transgelin [Spathaspora sp. JA1]|nr:Transgelin [Spathaspora sp. JA1]